MLRMANYTHPILFYFSFAKSAYTIMRDYIAQLGERTITGESRVRIPLSLLIFLAKITRPLMRKNSNIYFIGGFCYERENQKVYG